MKRKQLFILNSLISIYVVNNENIKHNQTY